jgi:hypothetical protein
MSWAFQTGEDGFKAGVVPATHRHARQSFDKGREQGSGFRDAFGLQGVERAEAEIFRQLIGPERLDDGDELVQSRGHRAAGGRIRMRQPTRVIQDHAARFAALGVSAGESQLPEGLAQHADGHAPHLRTAQNGGFFPRRQL